MGIRALGAIALVAGLGVFSSQALAQTVAPADLEKAATAQLQVKFFMGSAEIDRDSTNFRKMTKLQTQCKAKISADILAAPPIASADQANAILAVKKLFADCIDKGVDADPALKAIHANAKYVAGR